MVLARNKKAFHDYFIEDKLEAGMELVGTEVKSVKAGKVSIKESFIRIIKNEILRLRLQISSDIKISTSLSNPLERNRTSILRTGILCVIHYTTRGKY